MDRKVSMGIVVATSLLLGAVVHAQGNPTVEKGYKVSAALQSDQAFDLTNIVSGSSLTYKSQGSFGGINLGWTGSHGNYVTVKRQAGAGPVKYGEPVALKVEGGGHGDFLKYEHRDHGINLSWTKNPEYEWRIMGGTDGQPVGAGDQIAIVNNKENDSMIFCYRVNGAWLKWSKDCSRAEREAAKRGAPSR